MSGKVVKFWPQMVREGIGQNYQKVAELFESSSTVLTPLLKLILKQGCIFFIIGWLGKKYGDLLRKCANIRGKRSKNREKGGNFTVLGVKYHFGKRGRGKIITLWALYTPYVSSMSVSHHIFF